MKKKLYTEPGLRIIPMNYLEQVCASLEDYTVLDYEWEDEG